MLTDNTRHTQIFNPLLSLHSDILSGYLSSQNVKPFVKPATLSNTEANSSPADQIDTQQRYPDSLDKQSDTETKIMNNLTKKEK